MLLLTCRFWHIGLSCAAKDVKMRNFLKIGIDSKRVYGLDILRCAAILFVVMGHGNNLLPKGISKFSRYLILDGVSIFFVLSGFLIGGILIRILEKEKASFGTLVNFWSRRWFRTIPNYVLILSTLLLLAVLFTKDFSVVDKLKYFIFSQNLFYNHPDFFPEAWSLCVEEWFYLLIPIVIFSALGFLKASRKSAILFTAISVLSVITLFRYGRYRSFPINDVIQWQLMYVKQVFTRLDSLMYGVIGAYIAHYHKELWLKYKNVLLVTGMAILVFTQCLLLSKSRQFGLYMCVFSFSINSLATLFLLPFLSDYKFGSGRVYRSVTYISLISYSMYLVNLSLVRVWMIDTIHFTTMTSYEGRIKYIAFWFLTVALSALIYKYYEMPMTRLRDKFATNSKSHTS